MEEQIICLLQKCFDSWRYESSADYQIKVDGINETKSIPIVNYNQHITAVN